MKGLILLNLKNPILFHKPAIGNALIQSNTMFVIKYKGNDPYVSLNTHNVDIK